MALETGTFIDDLVDTNPPGTDPKKQGDDHLRLIKSVLQGTFPDAPRAFHFPNAPAAKTGNYTVVLTDQNALITVDVSGAARTVTLPTFASVFAGFSVTIQKSDTSVNTVTIDGNGAETINGDATKVLRRVYESITVTSDGSDWKITRRGSDETESIEGAAVASATTTNIWTGEGDTKHITGTTTITSFGNAPQAGAWRKVIFDGVLTLTHNGSTLVLPGSANITTAAADFAFVYADTVTGLRVLYFRKDGTAVVATTVDQATQAAIEAETNEDTYLPPDLLKHSPGVAKAWVQFEQIGAQSILASYNITSITDEATGDTTITISVDFSGVNYAAAGITGTGGSGAHVLTGPFGVSPAAGTFRVVVSLAAVAIDTEFCHVVFFGDQ